MKREICCPECAKKWRRTMGRHNADADGFIGPNDDLESLRLVHGTILEGCNSHCDGCGGNLDAGAPAVCVSLFSDALPYFEWEGDYVNEEKGGR